MLKWQHNIDILLFIPFRSQTTKGAWVAICDKIIPPIVLLDLEGTDGETRGQPDH